MEAEGERDTTEQGEMKQEEAGDATPADDEFKKPRNKKKRRKKGSCFSSNNRRSQGSQSKKPYQTCLPNSMRECSWLENTELNVKLLEEKNREIFAQREKKRQE